MNNKSFIKIAEKLEISSKKINEEMKDPILKLGGKLEDIRQRIYINAKFTSKIIDIIVFQINNGVNIVKLSESIGFSVDLVINKLKDSGYYYCNKSKKCLNKHEKLEEVLNQLILDIDELGFDISGDNVGNSIVIEITKKKIS